MAEWHITPEYIFNNWTDEKLDLMVSKLAERKQQVTRPESSVSSGIPKISDTLLFARAKNLVKVVSQ